MSKILVVGVAYIDEDFDYFYVRIWDKNAWIEHLKDVEERFKTFENALFVGYENAIRYNNFDGYVDTFDVYDITSAQANFLIGVGLGSFGVDITL